MHTLLETITSVRELGIIKVEKTFIAKTILSMIAGAAIAFGYITYFIITDAIGGGMGLLVGSSLFPIGLMIVLMAGGELLTGNMFVVGTSWLHKDVSTKDLILNWVHITLGNFVGAVLVAYVFVLYLGTVDPEMPLLIATGFGKVNTSPMKMIVSGIGCNIFVGLSVWMYIGSKDGFLKFMSIWFPIAVFVILGFQHVVANMFLLVILVSQNLITLTQYLSNLSFVFIGNAIGGVLFVGLLYALVADSLKS